MMVSAGKSLLLPSIRFSVRQWHLPRGRSSSTQTSPGKLPGPLYWILATARWPTVCPGWTSHLWQTGWRPQPGLKEDEHLTVKHLVFPREPYCFKIHKDAQYIPKSPTSDGFGDWKPPTTYQISHKMILDTEELARRSAIYASLADSMVASVIAELSPKDKHSKLLREKLAIIQEAQVAAVSSGFASGASHRSTCSRLSPTDASSSLHRRIRTRAKFTDATYVPWDNGRGPLYAFPPFKMVPQFLQKVAQSQGVQMILIAPLQETASWFPNFWTTNNQPLLTQDVTLSDEGIEIRYYRPSNLHAWSGEGPFLGGCWDDVKVPSRIITSSVWIALGEIRSLLHVKKMFRVRSHFSTYIMHLVRDGLLPLTIISHRASVASVLRHWEYDLAADPHIKLLIRAFQLKCPLQWRIMPKWDLQLILSALMSLPFVSEVDDQDSTSDDIIPPKWQNMKQCSC